jgi:hypothetical protein
MGKVAGIQTPGGVRTPVVETSLGLICFEEIRQPSGEVSRRTSGRRHPLAGSTR